MLTSAAPTDGPMLILMLNMLENLTRAGVVSWDSVQLVHYIVEVCSGAAIVVVVPGFLAFLSLGIFF